VGSAPHAPGRQAVEKGCEHRIGKSEKEKAKAQGRGGDKGKVVGGSWCERRTELA